MNQKDGLARVRAFSRQNIRFFFALVSVLVENEKNSE